MAWHPAFRLIRPDDQVVLDIRVTGIEGKKVTPPPPAGSPTARFEKVGSGPREIWVQFGPQQIIEYAQPEGGIRADQDSPLFVPRADLIFTVPDSQIPFPCTVEGLLGLLRRSSLKTTGGDPEVAAVTTPQRSGVDPHQLVAAGSASALADGEQRNRRHGAREAETSARRPPVTRAAIVTPRRSGGPPDTAATPADPDPLVAAGPGSAPGPVGAQDEAGRCEHRPSCAAHRT